MARVGRYVGTMQTHQLSGAWGRGAITEAGACVLSWAPAGVGEVLFVSRGAEVVEGQMWHGGIPVCAPWFGQGQGDWAVPHTHGLVSRVPWRTVALEQADDAARARFAVDAADTAHLPGTARYPDDLTYRLDVTMGASLSLALTVESPTREISIDEAFHPYLAIDASRAVVAGLEGVGFRDFAVGGSAGSETEPVRLDRHVDRVYDAASPTVLADGGREVALSADGAASTVVWNPGPGGSVGDEWARFACVEYGNVQGRAVTIPAGGSHTLTLKIEVAGR